VSYKNLCKILASFFLGTAIIFIIPFFLALYYQFFVDPYEHLQPHSTIHFFLCILISFVLGLICYYIGCYSTGQIYRREGIIAVVIIWFIAPALGGLPFYLSGTLKNPLQAYFEAVSGFTTSGSTMMQAKHYDNAGKEIPIIKTIPGVIPTTYTYWGTIEPIRGSENQILYEGVEAVSKALLFWRSFTNWIGGMGIVVLFVAILPALGVGGKMLFQTEIPGPIKDSLTPRIKETASQLWKIYAGLSLLQIIFLKITNPKLPWLDIWTIMFATISTGGFSIHNENMGAYDNAWTEWVVIVFMIAGAINFSLYFYVLKGKFYRFYDLEFIIFLIIAFGSCVFASWILVGLQEILITGPTDKIFDFDEAIRYGSFQIISTITSTGFSTANYDAWPYALQVLMIVLMYVGGMSGSTSGGIKIARIYMLFRIAQYKIESIFRPEALRRFTIGGREVDQRVAITVLCFFLISLSISALSTFLFVLDNVDPETAISLVALSVNNTGMGFRMASEPLTFLSNFGTILSSLLMLCGRLEFFAVLSLLVPAFWKQAS
jgi:trk system potassium uptake protein TrkH